MAFESNSFPTKLKRHRVSRSMKTKVKEMIFIEMKSQPCIMFDSIKCLQLLLLQTRQ